MARKPSFDFERRERDKAKDAKRAEKAKAKSEKKAGGADGSNEMPDEAQRDAKVARGGSKASPSRGRL